MLTMHRDIASACQSYVLHNCTVLQQLRGMLNVLSTLAERYSFTGGSNRGNMQNSCDLHEVMSLFAQICMDADADGESFVSCRAEAMLAEAVAAVKTQTRPDRHIAAQQSKRKKKMDPVTKLEKELLRASHGIEAELYQDL